MHSCPFCSGEFRKQHEVILESKDGHVVLHNDWAVAGHLMVVSPRHVENASELSADEFSRFAALLYRVEGAVLAATKADRAIIMKLGLAVPHLHIHIYPISRDLDREAVMKIIDARVSVDWSEEEKKELVSRLRSRIRSK